MEYLYIVGAGLLVGMLVAFSVEAVIWIAFALALLFVPFASTISPSLTQAHWVATMFYFWLWVIVGFRLFLGKVVSPLPPVPMTLWMLMLFAFTGALGSMYGRAFVEVIAAGKDYFQAWVIPLLFFLLLRREGTAQAIVIAILLLAIIQPIVAGWQYYTSGHEMYAGDRIGGTFGSGLGTGAVLSIFALSQALVLLALAQRAVLNWRLVIPLTLWVCIPMLWTHAKAIVVLLPLGVFLLFARDMRERPTLVASVTIISLIGAIFVAWTYLSVVDQYYDNPDYAPQTMADFVDGSLAYAITDASNAQLNRGSAIFYWWEKHSLMKNPLETLVGHGLGAAKWGGVVEGRLYADSRYGRPGMGVTPVTRLLWEVGIIGTFAFIGMLMSAMRMASRLAVNNSIPMFHRSVILGYHATLVIFLITLFWHPFWNMVTFVTFVAFVFGYLLYWYRVAAVRESQ